MPKRLKFVVFFCFIANFAKATQDQNYGLGGSTTGRVSSVTAEIDNPYAALFNPALLAAQSGSLFAFSTAQAKSTYQPLNSVLVDSAKYRTRDSTPRVENYTPAETQVTLWTAGFSYPFRLPAYVNRRAGLGLALSGPYSRLRSFNSTTPYDFVTLRYGNSDSQFKATAALAAEILPGHLYAGAGISLFITASGDADANLIADNPTGRLAMDVGLNTAAVAGLFGSWDKNQLSLVYRQEIHPTLEQKFAGNVQIDQGAGTVVLPVVLKTSLYYEPHLFEIEWQREFSFGKISAGVSYQLWSQYKASYLIVETPDADEKTRSTILPDIPFKNTLNPRVSVEVPFLNRKLHACLGYQYRPSPVVDLSGPGNLLDSDVHVFGASVQYRLTASEILPLNTTWAIYGQYHRMTSRLVEKRDPGFIGAPAYEFAGNAMTYGLSVQVEL